MEVDAKENRGYKVEIGVERDKEDGASVTVVVAEEVGAGKEEDERKNRQ